LTDLQDYLTKKDLSARGTKKVIIKRILDHLAGKPVEKAVKEKTEPKKKKIRRFQI